MAEKKTEHSALDLLLRTNLPDVQKELPTKKLEVLRLSELAGEKVIFTLRALPCSKVRQL